MKIKRDGKGSARYLVQSKHHFSHLTAEDTEAQ